MKRRNLLLGTAGLGVGLVSIQRLGRCDAGEGIGFFERGLVPGGLLDLQSGFRARIVQRSGDVMSDGFSVPSAPDSMACFEVGSTIVLMRNHEVGIDDHEEGPFRLGQSVPNDRIYDPRGPGGVTRVVLDAGSGKILSSNLVLGGTVRNCSGGINPYGWFSCEETLEDGHGYVFHCPIDSDSLLQPHRLPMLGRMNHEAAVAHPITGIVYLTEDRDDGLFYRFVPSRRAFEVGPVELWSEGQLQALSVKGFEGRSLNTLAPGQSYELRWIDVDHEEGMTDNLRYAGSKLGASIVQRGEGLWLDGERIVFTATSGGRHEMGQIFELSADQNQDARLKIIAEGSPSIPLLYPDNLCTTPEGGLFVAEDGDEKCRILYVSKSGQIRVLARNPRGDNEIAGVCYSAATKTIFCNLQSEGITVAIEGPFDSWLTES